MSVARRIGVFTATRAEYGLLFNTMKRLQQASGLSLQVIASGTHLSERHGATYRQLEADGFVIDAKVELPLEGDRPVDVALAMGRCTEGVAKALQTLRPDFLVVLGDRYEALAAAQAAAVMGVPIAHLCGGEVTEGALDESFRHAITKLAHLHFVAAEPYRRRVLQLGEDPSRVFVVGTPGLDNFETLPLLSKPELERALGFPFAAPTFLVTYHPATLGAVPPQQAMGELLAALERFPDARLVLTEPNADAGADAIRGLLRAFAERERHRTFITASLGQVRYLSALKAVDVVIGNSSSGLIEAPSAGVPTVNVGDRQAGRLRPASVIDVAESREAIEAAIRRALTPDFRALARTVENPYGTPGAAQRIVEILAKVDPSALRVKRFFDREWA